MSEVRNGSDGTPGQHPDLGDQTGYAYVLCRKRGVVDLSEVMLFSDNDAKMLILPFWSDLSSPNDIIRILQEISTDSLDFGCMRILKANLASFSSLIRSELGLAGWSCGILISPPVEALLDLARRKHISCGFGDEINL